MKSSDTLRGKRAGQRPASPRISPIAAACTTLLIASGSVYAQQDPATLDTVTVTGIRRAIESSIAVKRNSDSIVEAVSAEDIGKLPDASIAESLARLPGLTGQRGPDGRTQTISLRGLGGEFTGGLMNGREVVSSGDSRAVEYDQFPSELVGSVLVYKTGDASVLGQGLGGTVDVRTVRPLDVRGRQIAVNLRGESNSNKTAVPGVTSSTGNRFSLSYIDQFANNTIGVALGYAHLDSPTQLRQYQIWEFGDVTPWGAPVSPGIPKAVNGGGYALQPLGIEATVATKANKRDGFLGVLEFKPTKDFRSQLDLYYSKFDSHQTGAKFMISHWDKWSGPEKNPAFSNVGTTMVGKDTVVTSGTVTNSQTILQNFDTTRTDTISAVGWNNSLKLNDKWSVAADLSFSRDKRDERYAENFLAPYANGKWTLGTYNFSLPVTGFGVAKFVPTQNMADPAIMKNGDPADWVGDGEDAAFAGNIRKPIINDEIKSFRLSAKRSLDGMFSSLDFGLNHTQRDKTIGKNEYRLDMKKDAGGNFIRDIPSSAIRSPIDMSGAGIPSVLGVNVPALADGGFYNVNQALWIKASNDSAVHEKVTTVYGKLDIDTDVAGVPVRGNVGMQAVRTQQSADGWVWLGNNANPDLKDLYKVTGGKSYTDFLPNLNLVFDLKNSWIARFGWGRTMSRPTMNDMRAGADGPKVDNDPKSLTYRMWSAGTAGNPLLEPIRSNAVDLSIEKYFGKGSYVAVATFHKDIKGYIKNVKTLRDFTGFPNFSGVEPISNWGFANSLENADKGYVEGLELTAQLEGALLAPVLDGFGVTLSGTTLHSSIDNVPGFSGTATNLTLYYEKKGFSARVSQRYRSPFTSVERDVFFNNTSRYSSADKVVDLQFGYAFDSGSLKGMSVLLQVNNVDDRPTNNLTSVRVGGVDSSTKLPNYISYFGRQVLLGVNYKY